MLRNIFFITLGIRNFHCIKLPISIIKSLLNPELTASWEKGLTYVAEGSITEQEYMDKLEHFVRVRTRQVETSNYQYTLRQFFDAAAVNYRKPERASGQGGKKS